MFTLLHRALENPISRVILSVAIVISLIPHDWMHATDAWFAVLFGPEVIARTLLAFRLESKTAGPGQKAQTGWCRPEGSELLLLLLDYIAVLSFFPALASSLVGASWLRIFRLSRTVLLLRYWAPVVNDLWTVSWRPERRRQLFFVFGSLVVTCFAGAVLLDHLTTVVGDDFDGDGTVGDAHDHEFLVRMWWAFRQVEDPGNLLASPHDAGTVVVSVFLTIAGLFVISFIIGIGTDVVIDLSKLGRHRAPGLRGHTVLVNGTTSGERLLRELIHEEFKLLPGATEAIGIRWLAQLWRKLETRRAFVVVGSEEQRPDFLNEPPFTNVVYRSWEDDDDDTLLARSDLLAASRVVLLASKDDELPDDNTIRSLMTIVEQLRASEASEPRRVLAEIVSPDNLSAAQRAASRALPAHETSVVPTEVLIARCVAAVCRRQGLAELFTQLLRSEGREIYAWEQAEDSNLQLAACGGAAPLEALARAGCSSPDPDRRVVPLGLILAGNPGAGTFASLNPAAVASAGQVRGVIAIADNAAEVESLVGAHGSGNAASPAPKFEGNFSPEDPLPMRAVLVCGFRSATVQLLESLLSGIEGSASTEVLIVVADEDIRDRALEDFEAQGTLVDQGLFSAELGRFELVEGEGEDEDARVRWEGGGRSASLRLVVAEWTSPRALANLPGARTSVVDYDLVLFSSDGSGESDARNTTGLMTVEALAIHAQRARWPRIVAEVDDVELAARLNERYASMERHEVHVFSIDELRALVMFQSVVVPHFGSIYEELLTPGRRSLVPLRASGSPGRAPYPMVAETLRAHGKILVAVEQGEELSFGGGQGSDDGVDLQSARLWVI